LAIIHRRGSTDEEMTSGDQKVEQAADKLQSFASSMASEGGVKAKVAEPLADDADFLRKLKPSLIKARAKGEAPTDQPPGSGTAAAAPSGPQLGKRPDPKKQSGGVNPWLVAGVALAAGIFLAKWIDWRGHAHPRD
jgi:hypothetical protein